jgi:hypothetical protein
MPNSDDSRERLREKVAAEHGFQLYKRYSEKHAATRIGLDYSTLKRKRRAGLVPFVDLGGGSVGYMGYHIADIITLGVRARHDVLHIERGGEGTEPWASTAEGPSSLENGFSTKGAEARPTIVPATTGPPASLSALALARLALKKPGRS